MQAVLDAIQQFGVPLVLFGVLALVGGAVAAARRGEHGALLPATWRRMLPRIGGYTAAALIVYFGWAALAAVPDLTRTSIGWKQSSEATTKASTDAAPVRQFGPSVAGLTVRTYTRTLTLPPYLVQRIGSSGVGVLAPYLSDPSAENVLRLVDTFRHSGSDVVFTRDVTRLDEEPIPFASSVISARFHRVGARAYDLRFEAQYAFRNPRPDVLKTRFAFPLPETGTIQDVQVSVGRDLVPQPADSGAYEWTGELQPGEQRTATVRYRTPGSRTWHYDFGSRRRTVQQFRLDAATGGPVKFLRGSLQPTAQSGDTIQWVLNNVVTSQQVSLSFPADTSAQQCYLQALGALPVGLLLFAVGSLAVGFFRRQFYGPDRLCLALVGVTFGLGAAAVLSEYVGALGGILLAVCLTVLLAGAALGRSGVWAAAPAALMPAVFLSPHHSGLLLLGLVLATVSLAGRALRRSGWREGLVP